MFCSNCGAKMSDDSAFCPECGTPIKPGNSGNSHQTINQNSYQAPMQSQKEIPAAGTKQAKTIIVISGFLVFISLFMDAVKIGEGSASIYERLKVMRAEGVFWIVCVSILLVIILNVLNLQKWSLIGSLGMFVFMIAEIAEVFKFKKATAGYASLNIGFWLFTAATTVCLVVAVREAVLSFFAKSRESDRNVAPSPAPSQPYAKPQAQSQPYTKANVSRPTAQKPKKGLKTGGIVLFILGVLAVCGGFANGDYRRIIYLGIEFQDVVTIGMEIAMIIGGIVMIIKSRNGK